MKVLVWGSNELCLFQCSRGSFAYASGIMFEVYLCLLRTVRMRTLYIYK